MKLNNSREYIGEDSRLGRPHFSFIDKVFLAFIFLIPLIPRPTVEHPAKFLAPLSISFVIYIWTGWLFIRGKATLPKHTRFTLLTFLLIMISILYVLKILVNQEWDEPPYLASRILSFFCMIVFLSWMLWKRVPIREIYKLLFYGFMILSLLVIFVGFTGYSFFNEIKPPRVFGITLPFFKTIAIPRSYGEFGVIASTAWAYFLIYKSKQKRILRIIYFVILALSILISQSRSVYLAIVIVSLAFFLLKIKEMHKVVLIFLIILSLLLPLITGLLLPSIKEIPPFDALIGEGIYEVNVYRRYDMYKAAISLIINEPRVFLLGISHSKWLDFYYGIFSVKTGLHNYFLSNIVFLGFLNGILSLLIFVIPIVNLIRMKCFKEKEYLFIILATLGLIVCLQFYEGFFSIIAVLNLSTLWYIFIRREKCCSVE